MTTTDNGESRSTAFDTLANQLGSDNAAAVAAYVASQLEANGAELAEVRQQLVELDRRVGDNDELRGRLAAAAQLLLGETHAHNDQVRQHRAGEDVSQAEAEESGERISQVREQVNGVSEELMGRIERLESISAPRLGSERDNRFEDIEADVTGLTARVDQLESRANEHESVIASAFASARATLGDLNTMRRAALFGLVTFVVSFLLYALVWVLVDSMNWEWDNALGVPAIIAGIVAALVFLRADHGEVEAVSYAQAAAMVRENNARAQNGDAAAEPAAATPASAAQPAAAASAAADARVATR